MLLRVTLLGGWQKLTPPQKWAAYTISPAAFPELCLAPNGTDNGANLVLADCSADNTVFKYSDVNGKVKIGKKCVDIRDGIEKNGTLAQIWDCVVCNDHQSFDFVSDNVTISSKNASSVGAADSQTNGTATTPFQLQWTFADYCLDLHEGKGEVGAQVQIWGCLGYNDNQKWIVNPVNATSVNATAPADGAEAAEELDESVKRSYAQAHARRHNQKRMH